MFDDQLSAVANDSRRWGTTGEVPDLALLVDGLQAEREQGITIDVAYRYFQTPKRKFIVADCPGHEQYTRNMATGASTADAAVVLVDAEKGVRVQTRRHTHIVSLLGVQNVILAVNKMDRIDYDRAKFEAIAGRVRRLRAQARRAEHRSDPGRGAGRRERRAAAAPRKRPGTRAARCSRRSKASKRAARIRSRNCASRSSS